jgi:hypothetical protein
MLYWLMYCTSTCDNSSFGDVGDDDNENDGGVGNSYCGDFAVAAGDVGGFGNSFVVEHWSGNGCSGGGLLLPRQND